MNQYMLSVNHLEGEAMPSGDAFAKISAAVDALNKKLMEKKAWVFACGLHPRSSATVVKVKDGEVLITDGPFIEAKEYLGGFWIIKAPDLDAALEWARQATVACTAPIEVRPLQEGAE